MKRYSVTVMLTGGGISRVLAREEWERLKTGRYGSLSCTFINIDTHPGLYDLTFQGSVRALSVVGAQRRALRYVRRWIKAHTEVVIYADRFPLP